MPVRIYDIAKKLGIESKQVLAAANALGIKAKVPSSSLDKITAEYLEEQLAPLAKKEAPPAPPPPTAVPPPPPVEPTPQPEVTSPAAPIVSVAPPVEIPVAPSAPEVVSEFEPAAAAVAPPPGPEMPVVEEPRLEPVPVPQVAAAPATVQPEPPPLVELPPPAPPPPPEPAKPRIGDLVGRISLPPKPMARVPDKQAARPPARPMPQRNEAVRGRPGDARGGMRTIAPAGGRPGMGNRAGSTGREAPAEPKFVPPTTGEIITLKPPIIVRELAEKLSRKPHQIIADLVGMNVWANVNQAIEEPVAQRLCAKYGFRFEVEKRKRDAGLVHAPVREVELDFEDKSEDLKLRPPVVTIMGHVDHGKTTLLDGIRQSNVAAGEAGGITQHIGAYTISFPHPERKEEVQQITFLDTPGHAAFSAMRARGANVTDLVVLVVAANDGVMPQTIEALNHARAAKVPILVAVNKIDHPNSNPLRVRQQLQDKGLVPDDWGGDTIFVDVSALTKKGVDKLLEMILLQAELLELRANPNRRAKGNVIESGLSPGGPTATVLVRKGTLHQGDIVLCDQYWGRVRALINEEGKRLKEAGPSTAVKLLGLNGIPDAGLEFSAVEDEKNARELAETRAQAARLAAGESRISKVTLENLFDTLATASSKTLKVVVKADTQGSEEAIVDALKKVESDKVALEVVHSAVGTITESDVNLASASHAVILGFHTRIDAGVSDVAKREGVQIRLYSIIYELVDQVKDAMAGLLEPILKEVVIGVAEVRKVFDLSKGGRVAGCVIQSGRITKGKARVMRRRNLLYEGVVQSLRRFQDEVNEVRAGMECGIRMEGFSDFQPGDTIESFMVEKVSPKL